MENTMYISKIDNTYVGVIKNNIGTDRNYQITETSIMLLIERAYRENPKEILPNLKIELAQNVQEEYNNSQKIVSPYFNSKPQIA